MLLGRQTVERMVREYTDSLGHRVQGESTYLETAMFLEESFGIRLSDEEISPEQLADPSLLVDIACAKLGV